MKGKLRELNLQVVICFQFLDTPGNEITPRSNEIRKDFEHERFRHESLLNISVRVVDDTSKEFKALNIPNSINSTFGACPKSKGIIARPKLTEVR